MQLQYAASVSVRLEYLHPCIVGDVVSVETHRMRLAHLFVPGWWAASLLAWPAQHAAILENMASAHIQGSH